MSFTDAKYFCYNGTFFRADKPILHHQNRGFRYNDAFSEGIRSIGNQPLFFDDHFSRISKAMQLLQFAPPTHFNKYYLRSLTEKLLTKNRIFKGGHILVILFRDGEGAYAPENNHISFIIECQPFPYVGYTSNKKGKKITIYSEDKIPLNRFANFKHSNHIIYLMAGLFAKSNGYDDLLLLNENGHLCQAIGSNFFLYKHQALYTPSMKDACIDGIIRQQIIRIAKASGISVFDDLPIKQGDLLDADEIFTTDPVNGIEWVLSYKNKRYFHSLSDELIRSLNKEVQPH